MVLDYALGDHVRFVPPRKDVMACGLPVIVSAACGVSEIITDGSDGLVLADSTDADTLAAMIHRLYSDKEFRAGLGKKAAETAQQYTWDRNAHDLAAIFKGILRKKASPAAHTLEQAL